MSSDNPFDDIDVNEHLSSLQWAWQDKEDLERYCMWESILPALDKARPDVVEAWNNYKRARRILDAVMVNL